MDWLEMQAEAVGDVRLDEVVRGSRIHHGKELVADDAHP